ncbi:MAG: hypothetical protein QM582_03535 [Micropruina sp.]
MFGLDNVTKRPQRTLLIAGSWHAYGRCKRGFEGSLPGRSGPPT